jgi:hypothetical protein
MLVWALVHKSLMITAFVAVMMIAIEYLNVQTRGTLVALVGVGPARQYLIAALLGSTPGCLGAFAAVALYTHGNITFGALTAAMIATSGDESFVMFAVFPQTALLLTLALTLLAVGIGWITDQVVRQDSDRPRDACSGFTLHHDEPPSSLSRGRLLAQWRPPSAHRATLTAALLLFLWALLAGHLGLTTWDWKRVTLLLVTLFGLFVVTTVSEHFLDAHLWEHVARRHVPRILCWTLCALGTLAALDQLLDLEALVSTHRVATLALAALVGVLPESGPHLLFVTLFAAGQAPLSVLVTSSIVQDGHGAIPLLATSRRDFIRVKAINLLAGSLVGAVLLAAGH